MLDGGTSLVDKHQRLRPSASPPLRAGVSVHWRVLMSGELPASQRGEAASLPLDPPPLDGEDLDAAEGAPRASVPSY
jgi:hypothetical protein